MNNKIISIEAILIGICVFFGAFFGTKYAANRADLFDSDTSIYHDLNLTIMPGSGAIEEKDLEATKEELRAIERELNRVLPNLSG